MRKVTDTFPKRRLAAQHAYSKHAYFRGSGRIVAHPEVIRLIGTTDRQRYVGQCPGILIGPQRRDTGTLRRFPVLIPAGKVLA
jgi:hypothetical protein